MNMKRTIICVTALLLAVLMLFTACQPSEQATQGTSSDPTDTPSTQASQTPTATQSTQAGTSTPSSSVEPEPTPEGTPEPIPSHDVIHQDDIYKWVEENDKYADTGYNTLNMVSVDEHGRVFMTATGVQEGKEVGVFYHLSQGFFKGTTMSGIYDVSKLIAEYGPDKVFKQFDRKSPNNKEHFWGEPLYGYYDSEDPYIIRKQLELFITTGIDYLVLDVTNGWIFTKATTELMKVICQLRQDGWDAPQIVFYCHSLNNKTVREIYRDIYQAMPEYSQAWYVKDGKPAIIAYTETAKDIAEAKTRGETNFVNNATYADLSQEILDFFTFVEPRWPNDGMLDYNSPIHDKKVNGQWQGLSWIEWVQPLRVRQTSLGSFMNVAVASHPSIPFSFSITRGVTNWGRNYDVVNNVKVKNGEHTGTYYQNCWDQVFEKQPETVMLVMWNGWCALKSEWDGEYMMCDTCDFEYSLSIEPANGYYKDSYVHQTSQNVRKYKYNEGAIRYSGNRIDINGSYAQWYNVAAVYRQIGTEAYGRDYMSADGKKYHYTQAVPKNNLQEVRTTHDEENVYMMIRCGNAITAQEGEGWMNVFLSEGKPNINKGWEGYNYVINRKGVKDGKATIEKLDKDYGGSVVGEADIVVRDEFMFLKIPKSVVNVTNNSFYFKVADSVENPEDIMSYYTSGSVFPVGRYSYSYSGK